MKSDPALMSDLEWELSLALHRARFERFEDGMDSSFSVRLNDLLLKHGLSLIHELKEIFDLARKLRANIGVYALAPSIAEEIYRFIGSANHSPTHYARRQWLEELLTTYQVDEDAIQLAIASIELAQEQYKQEFNNAKRRIDLI